MSMSASINENMAKSLAAIEEAALKADMLFFPELQLTPFFPLFRKTDLPGEYASLARAMDNGKLEELRCQASRHHIWVSPNYYCHDAATGGDYDTSFMIDANGGLVGESHMVHILNAPDFWEQDYYTPSPDGLKVFDSPWGRIGIVICFDRHMPESIRTVALMGAQLVIIPTANLTTEPMDLFEAEIRTQAYQNGCFIAMCNRVGEEQGKRFAGESLVVDPDGNVLTKADDRERMVITEINLQLADKARSSRPFLSLRRRDSYAL